MPHRPLRARKDVCDYLKQRVLACGYHTQQQLADDAQMAKSTVSKFLTGKNVAAYVAEELCKRLDCNIEDIVENYDEGTQDPKLDSRLNYINIWKEEKTESKAISLVSTLLRKELYSSPLVNKQIKIDINIINPEGDAIITWIFECINVSKKNIEGVPKQVWFEKGQKDKINLRCINSKDTIPVSLSVQRDYDNCKHFYIRFGIPLLPQSKAKYSYTYETHKMFFSPCSHYWDMGIRDITNNITLNISHNKNRRLKNCWIEIEGSDGVRQILNSNITTEYTDVIANINWSLDYPLYNHTYRINWAFYD